MHNEALADNIKESSMRLSSTPWRLGLSRGGPTRRYCPSMTDALLPAGLDSMISHGFSRIPFSGNPPEAATKADAGLKAADPRGEGGKT